MIIDSLCPPAVLYLGFSVIQIIIDLFRGQQNSAFLKVIVMIIFTILLNQLCIGGLTILSWFIVFIPFIMMTYVTTILLYVFGLNPSKGKNQPPDPRRRRHPNPRPYNPQDVGGCAGTEFGCCPDGVTASNEHGSNCFGPGPQPDPGPQPAPPPHHHHGHHYPPSPSPSPGPTPTPTSANYSCTPMAPGMNPSCHPDMNGIYTSIAECEQDPKCPGPTPAPTSTNYSCVSIGGMKGCKLDPTGMYPSIAKCKQECNSKPVTPTATTAAPVPPNRMMNATAAPTRAPTPAPTPNTACWTTANAKIRGQCMGGWTFDGNDTCTAPAGSNQSCSPYSWNGMTGYDDNGLNSWVKQCGQSNPPGCQ